MWASCKHARALNLADLSHLLQQRSKSLQVHIYAGSFVETMLLRLLERTSRTFPQAHGQSAAFFARNVTEPVKMR
jgi:hypothetical protein